jgi:beta/gamma crystallin
MRPFFALAFLVAGIAAAVPAAAQQPEAILYSGDNFTGRSLTLRKDAPNFVPLDFNDRASSLKVRRGTWELCDDAGYGGKCHTFGPGDYRALRSLENRVSSARPVRGNAPVHPRIVLFDGEFSGRSAVLDGPVDNFERVDFNDRVDSIVVERGRWKLCSDARGAGHCKEFGPGSHRLSRDLRNRVSSAYPH